MLKIEPVFGLELRNRVISNREFKRFSIFSTAQVLEEYFKNYGYHFQCFYDEDHELVVVKDCNRELEQLLQNSDNYSVINYKTGEVCARKINISEVLSGTLPEKRKKTLFSFQYRIEEKGRSAILIEKSSSEILLEAEEMYFLDYDKLFYSNYGMEYIYDLQEKVSYPLLKREKRLYVGNHPEEFLDIRKDFYYTFQNAVYPLFLGTIDLYTLDEGFRLFPYFPHYGIYYENGSSKKTNWFPSETDRNQVLEQISISISEILETEKGKQKRID